MIRTIGTVACLTAATGLLLSSSGAHASHNDSTMIGLRVTVSDVTDNAVTVDVGGQGVSSSELRSARLGSEFWYDGSAAVDRWVQTMPPAIDWGDGSTVANLAIPFTEQTTTISGRFISSFSGQFMHTYATPGTYTIRSFGTNVYAVSPTYYGITEGNTFSALSPGIVYDSGARTVSTWSFGTVPIGLTNTDTVSITGYSSGYVAASSDSRVPGEPVRSGDCGLIGIELMAVYPIWALARARRRATVA
jgi:hypothetical protein